MEIALNDILTLISQLDGTEVKIDKRSARLSTLLKNLQDDYQENVIRVAEVPGIYLSYIAEYLNHYKETDPPKVKKPLARYDIELMYGRWEDEFITKFIKDKTVLWELMNHANFMECDSLMDLASAKISVMIKDFSPKEILDYFGMKEDLTPEEARQMHNDFINKLNGNEV